VNLLVKNDFIKNHLMDINLSELIESIRVLLQQGSVVEEIKKMNSIFEERSVFNEKDLIKIYFKWKSNFLEMSEIEKRDLYKEELKASKGKVIGS
jgi:hypothetical protein